MDQLQWSRTATSNTKGEIVETDEGQNNNRQKATVVESDSNKKHNTKEEIVKSDCSERNMKEEIRLKENQEIRGAIMVIAILGATVAYQAVLNPPGGFWQDDLQSSNSTKGHIAGKPIMATKNPLIYGTFVAFNIAAFAISFLVMMIIFMPSFLSSMKRESFLRRYLIYKWMNINISIKSIDVDDCFLLQQYMAWVYCCLSVALSLWIYQHLKGPGRIAFVIAIASLLSAFIPISFLSWKSTADTTSLRRNSV